MPFGILEPKLAEGVRVPGTVHLYEALHGIDETENAAHLKRDGDIILVPQPSNSSNDPLNWSRKKKDLILAVLCLAGIMASTASPLLASSTIVLVLYLGKGFQPIALLTGWNLFAAAITSIFVTAISVKYGKRFLYVFASVILIAGSAWGSAATSYRSLLGARILQGVALAPFEALLNASIGDMYFVHERGIRLAIASLCVFGSSFLTPVITGRLTATLGWHWMFLFLLIFSCVSGLLVFFFVPEHVYNRDKRFETDVLGEAVGQLATPSIDQDEKVTESNTLAQEVPESYLHSLWLFSGSKSSRPLHKIFLRPFALLLHPAVIWGCLTQGTLIAWTVMIGVVLAAIFMGPPLWYDEVNVGYMYAGAAVGSVVGFVFAGLLSDFLVKSLSKKNNNIYEPEFRILLVLPQMAFAIAGIWGFGITANDMYTYSKFLPPVFFGMVTCAMILGAVASSTYITDAHRDIQVEAFIVMLMFKNLFSFALTERAYFWLLHLGVRKCFVIVGSVQIAISVFTLLFWVIGKYDRHFTHKYNIIAILHLD
ncbi:major facilitator superfamily domain-containing protein [Lipomyces arxii]|uniref:major facilitator superfamily domain-containing protein n=1 Tax=Lipomyces arxii TaxID=56418 RepID=UPI0034CEB241